MYNATPPSFRYHLPPYLSLPSPASASSLPMPAQHQLTPNHPASSLTTSRATFDSTFATARWLSTAGLRVFLQFWFSRKPIFYLPVGAAPVYVQWLLCFPRAPMGSVSIQAWGMACASVITLVSDALVAAWGLVNGVGRAQAASASARPQGVGVGIGAGAGGGAGEEKKEL